MKYRGFSPDKSVSVTFVQQAEKFKLLLYIYSYMNEENEHFSVSVTTEFLIMRFAQLT